MWVFFCFYFLFFKTVIYIFFLILNFLLAHGSYNSMISFKEVQVDYELLWWPHCQSLLRPTVDAVKLNTCSSARSCGLPPATPPVSLSLGSYGNGIRWCWVSLTEHWVSTQSPGLISFLFHQFKKFFSYYANWEWGTGFGYSPLVVRLLLI